jgi:hypothetical protein
LGHAEVGDGVPSLLDQEPAGFAQHRQPGPLYPGVGHGGVSGLHVEDGIQADGGLTGRIRQTVLV